MPFRRRGFIKGQGRDNNHGLPVIIRLAGVMKTDFFDQVRSCYNENRQGLFTYALALTRNRATAEDIVHAVICRLLDRGRMPRDGRPYLFRAVRNAAVDNWRRTSSREEQLFEPDHNGAITAEQPDQALQVHQCLFRLELAEREVIVLKIYQGLTFREIGRVREQSANTAASHYRRGLEKMKTMLTRTSHETSSRGARTEEEG